MLSKRTLFLAIVATTLALGMQAAVPISPTDQSPRILRAANGHPLSLPSQAAPAALVSEYLRGHGQSEATVRSLRTQSEHRSARTGITHIRMSQEVAGLWVYDTYVKAAVNSRGELVNLIENLAPAAAQIGRPSIDESDALRVALAHLGIESGVTAQPGRGSNTVTFERGGVFLEPPSVTRVAVPMSDRSMTTGFVVTTWTTKGNLLHETLVDGKGLVVSSELRTNNDRYNVFPENPDDTTQQLIDGPGSGNLESPGGWLAPGDHTTVEIAGNNVHSYLDTVNDSVPDGTGATVSNGMFLTAADLSKSPEVQVNQEVAVQNLFYHNNLIHDILYRAGFDEAAGNFQEDNFGVATRGDGDSVQAEAQDGGGLDNANFATPRDGQKPRMQMYLWSAATELLVNSPANIAGSYAAAPASFGPTLDTTGITGDLKLADDGTAGVARGRPGTPGGTVTDGCEAFPTGFFAGKIALIDRGFCDFVVKVKNAQNAGATGVVVVNNEAGNDLVFMGGSDSSITIPSVAIGNDDGGTIRGELGSTVNAQMHTTGLPRDGSLDTDIIYHEYGHGLTWRMIGRMDGAMSGAIGEGMSDVLSLIINDDDVIGEYSASNDDGIRRDHYETYPRTYGDFSAEEVHDDGEIYGAIGWRMWKLFNGIGLDADDVLAYLVDGMNYTNANPTFEQMRDGILAGMSNSGAPRAHQCIVWQAFAQYGVGVGASGTVHGSNPIITESFAVPADCP